MLDFSFGQCQHSYIHSCTEGGQIFLKVIQPYTLRKEAWNIPLAWLMCAEIKFGLRLTVWGGSQLLTGSLVVRTYTWMGKPQTGNVRWTWGLKSHTTTSAWWGLGGLPRCAPGCGWCRQYLWLLVLLFFLCQWLQTLTKVETLRLRSSQVLTPALPGPLWGIHAEEAAQLPTPKAAHHDPIARPQLIGPAVAT